MLSAGALFFCASVSHACAAGLPSGTYDCYLSSGLRPGKIEIHGNTYRGPAQEGKFQGSYPFEVSEGGTIRWGGPLGSLSSGGNTVVSSTLSDPNGKFVGFDIVVRTASGTFQTAACRKI
jgi:hypothetical protein